MFEFILCLSVGILIGLVSGFPLGFLCTKKPMMKKYLILVLPLVTTMAKIVFTILQRKDEN